MLTVAIGDRWDVTEKDVSLRVALELRSLVKQGVACLSVKGTRHCLPMRCL